MTTDSPVAVLFNSDGYEVNVKPNIAIPAGTTGILASGSDGTNARFIKVDASGDQVVVGAGTAGTPSGGVITIQGDPAGTAIPITGSVSVTNASVGSNGAAIPGSSTQVGGSDGTNLQPIRLFDLDSGGGTQYVMGVGLRKASSGGSVEFGTSADPIRIDPTGTTTQPISGTVAATQSGTWTVQPGNTANTTPWLTTISQGGNAATVTGANALKVDGSAVTQPVSGTVTANIGTSGSLALDATLTGGTQRTKITDGTNNAAVKAASTAPVAADPALVVAISPNSTISTNADGYATTSAPTYTNNTFNPLSLTTSGALRVDGSATTQPVSGTVTANIGTTGGLALDATLTGGTMTTRITDGTNTATVKAASTAAVATDKALVVAISPNNSITTSNASVGLNGSAIPTSSTQIGGSDGTNLQVPRVFDADSGAGTQYVLGVGLRKSASGGSVDFGTSSDPIRIDPTGTTAQPVTDNGGSITIDTTQLPAALVGGRLDTNIGAWLGSTAPTVGQKTMANSIPIAIASDQSTITISGTVTANAGTGTFTTQDTSSLVDNATFTDGTSRVLPAGYYFDEVAGTALTENDIAAARIDSKRAQVLVIEDATTRGQRATVSAAGAIKVDGSAVTQPVSGTVTANIGTTNGLALDATLAKLTITQSTALGSNTQALVGGSVTTAAPTYTTGNINPLSLTTAGALRVDGSGSTQPVSGTVTSNQGTAASLANAWSVKITDTTNGPAAVKAASTAAVATDQALVVAVSPNNSVTVTQSTASNLRSQTSSESNTGSAVPTQASMVGGTDGTNLRAISVDSSGRQIVIGAAADGAAVTGNPVLMAGQDGTNAQSILTDTTGRQVMVGAAADGAAVTGNPILIGGQDGTNAQSMLTDTTGRPVVVGAGAVGAPVGGIVSTQVPDTTGSGTLNALNATASIALAGTTGASLQLSAGTLIGTIVPEISYDGGTTWSISLFQDPTNATFSASITFSAANGANAQTIIVPAGASNARVRVSLFTSGTATANVRSTTFGNVVPSLLTHTINTTSHALGKITTASTSQTAIRQTTFTEQSSNAQRSVSSASANDTSAGTGARTIKITYYDASFAGPFTVTLTMNGTSNVNTVVTNICYVEKIEVLTVGSTGSNVGIISLFGSTGGAGGTIGTIAATDNRTFWAHHYIPSGKNCYITQMHGANSDGTNGTLYVLKSKSLNANSAEAEISGILDGGGQVDQGVTTYQTPIFVAGPARVVLYGTPDGSGSITNRGYFSYYDL